MRRIVIDVHGKEIFGKYHLSSPMRYTWAEQTSSRILYLILASSREASD